MSRHKKTQTENTPGQIVDGTDSRGTMAGGPKPPRLG